MRRAIWLTLLSASLYIYACGGGTGHVGDAGLAGGAGGSPIGGSGGGGTAIDTHPQTPTAFCLAENRALCGLAFQCVPAAERDATFTSTFGASQSECQNTVVPSLCTTANTDCPGYDASLASSCVTAVAAFSCADLVNQGEPTDCMLACSTVGGTGGAPGSGGAIGTGGASGTGGRRGSGGISGAGGVVGTGGRSGTGGASGTGGTSGQLPLCPSDYETADCTVANQSCRIDCASGLCGCTCMSTGGNLRWSCVIF
jgi:hypothetical protein